MRVTITQVVDAFQLFYESIHDKEFRKTKNFHQMGERELAPLVRTFLLGAFGYRVTPEFRSHLPGSLTGRGSIDFIVGDVAVEFAVRRYDKGSSSLSTVTNSTEIKKLMKFDGLSLLVLFDMSSEPYEPADIERYRDWVSLGKGNHKRYPFSVAYFYRNEDDEPDCMLKRIRV